MKAWIISKLSDDFNRRLILGVDGTFEYEPHRYMRFASKIEAQAHIYTLPNIRPGNYFEDEYEFGA